MNHPEPPEYLGFLEAYPQETQALARALRQKLLDILPTINEFIYDATNTVGSGFSLTERKQDHFIHLPTYTKYVNIGFNQGALLNDPENRLQGNGAKIRHIKLTKASDLDDSYLVDLINQALQLATKSESTPSGKIEIIVMNGPKRRPAR
ncbi:MAG: DUF1801 domain-containing protein [Fimbriimonadaceae bacterium]